MATPEEIERIRALAQPPKQRRRQPEKAFTSAIKRYAKRGGWLAFHNLHAQGSDPGFLDLILLRPPRLVIAEQKVEGRKTTDWQDVWIAYWQTLAMLAGPHLTIEVFVWEPADWPEIERILD